jgi:hypothetical protein
VKCHEEMEQDLEVKALEPAEAWDRVEVGAGGFAAGPGGNCICPNCGERLAHQIATPCFERKCPKCGASMTRE